MADSVGEIGLDLVVNQNGFNRQMQGIGGLAKKAGLALAGAFAVKKLVDFGKSCMQLGSDLQEVQNVVDVTFPNMSARVDEFAKSAAASFGLSETMSKKFTGTFGAMAKAFGFSEKEAFEMGSALTGLSGDVASFYNISQDEAYTKLKSVFTGETETLKDLGIVMTQNALDAYAMANGFGKITAEMSEAEKVALRYAFVQDQLALASGDFARTSGGWANQVRILNLQFDSLKATIGQGLINLFTPIIKGINTLLGKLATLANAFKAFTELITGNKSSGSSGITQTASEAAETTEGLESASSAAGNLADNTKAAGKAAKKAAKDMKQLSGLDKLNNVTTSSPSDGGGSGGSGGSGGTGAAGTAVDYGKLADGETVVDKQASKFQALIDRVKELASLFKKGFTVGLGDTSVLDSITNSMKSITKSFGDIFTDVDVAGAVNNFVNSFVNNFGKVIGAFTSIGLTIADNILGGISKYLEQNKDRIKTYLVSMFDIGTEVVNIVGDFSVVLADIATVFRSGEAKQITADIIAIFTNAFLGLSEIAAKSTRDFLKAISEPIVNNKDKIKSSIQGLFEGVEPIFTSLSDLVTHFFEKWNEVYDQYVAPAWEKFSSGLDKIVSIVLDAFNKFLLPVIKRIGKEFKKLAESHLKPLIDSFLEFCGKLTDAVMSLWDFLSPFIGWFIEKFIAQIATKLEFVWNKVKVVVSLISDVLKGIFDVLSGLIDFIVGVFTGDWEKAWNGIKDIFGAIWDMLKSVVEDALTFIGDTITTGFNAVKNTIEVIWDGICLFFSAIWKQIQIIYEPVIDFFKEIFTKAIDGIKLVFGVIGNWMKEQYDKVVKAFSSIGKWFKDKFETAYKNIVTAFQNIGKWAKEKWDAVSKVFQNVASWFGKKFEEGYTNITNAFSDAGDFFVGIWKGIKSAFGNIAGWFRKEFTDAWEAVKKVFSSGGKVFDGIKDGILNGLKAVINGLINGINKVIAIPFSGLNKALDKVRDVEFLGTKPLSGLGKIDTPQIPPLAQGGYVKKNTPQLAMIGDNRHQGEVVAPEDKLKALLNEAVASSSGGLDINPLLIQLKQVIDLLKAIYGKEYMAYVKDSEVFSSVRKNAENYKKVTGRPVFE